MSKKIIFLAFVSAGLMFSCQKTNIQPNSPSDVTAEETPVWRGVGSSNTEVDTDQSTDSKGSLSKGAMIERLDITDPNNDEDRNKKKKGNQ